MITTILSHEVKDYNSWKKVFDEDAPNRSKMGVKITGLYKSVDNPKMITIFCEVPSEKAIKDFMANPDLKVAMEKGGVIGMPEVKILNKI
jgi:hypothetical protein